MIKPIVRDMLFLGQKSEEATKEDIAIIDDLTDTLSANKDRCVWHLRICRSLLYHLEVVL